MKAALFWLAIVAYLCRSLYPAAWLQWVVSAASLLIIIVVLVEVKGFVRLLGSAFLLVGASLYALHGAGWPEVLRGFGNMLNILSLFAIIPLIALPIRLGLYAQRVQEMIRRSISHSGALYAVTSSFSYALSSFMNVATFPMMVYLIRPSLELFPILRKERFISRAITHGFAMPTLWTPVTPIVGIIVEMTGASWGAILAIAVPFSLLGLIVDIWMGVRIAGMRRKQRADEAISEMSAAQEPYGSIGPAAPAAQGGGEFGTVKPRHPAQILCAIVAFNALIYVLERTTHFGFMLNVTLAVIPFALVWSLMIGRGQAFVAGCKEAIPAQVLKMKDQFFVFLSAGFMISAIQVSGVGHELNGWIQAAKLFVGSDLFLIMIPFIPLALAFIGFHPAVALALTAESLNPAALGISVEITAMAMLIGASAAFLMGPFNATIGMMSNLVGQTNYRISNWNAPFTALYMALGMLLLLALHRF